MTIAASPSIPRFGAQHRHFQVKLNYDEPGKPAMEINENVKARVPTRATSIVWVGSSFRVGHMFFRRTLRNYMIPALQFLLHRRII